MHVDIAGAECMQQGVIIIDCIDLWMIYVYDYDDDDEEEDDDDDDNDERWIYINVQ